MKTSIRYAVIAITAIVFVTGHTVLAQKAGGPWVIPAKYKSMKSSIKAGDPSISSVGKDLYNKNCKSCHGTKGLGDGTKSANLKTAIPSFADKTFKARPDGEIYFQSFVGRDEMPNFEKKIMDEADRWAVVYYIKSL